MKTKAQKLLEMFHDFDHDYGYSSKIAGHEIGQLTLDDGVGTVEIDLPLDNIDPDSSHVAVVLTFDYDDEDFATHIKMEVSKYMAADDGEAHDLPANTKQTILDYLKNNKAKLEQAFEKFIQDEYRKAHEDDFVGDPDDYKDRDGGRQYGRYEPYNYGTKQG